MLKIISAALITEINKTYAGGVLIRPSLDAIYASYFYYDTPEKQIASIANALLKGHFFADGNKRTALTVFIILAKINGIKYKINDETAFEVIIATAKNHYKIEEVASMLF